MDLYDDLVNSSHGAAPLPNEVPPSIESFKQMTNSRHELGLQYADLNAVYVYLRRGKGLKLTKRWRSLLPRNPEEL